MRRPGRIRWRSTEYLFPFASVVEVPERELVERWARSLAVTAITEDAQLRRELLDGPCTSTA